MVAHCQWAAVDHPPVTVILLLETAMTTLTFSAFWVSLIELQYEIFNPPVSLFVPLAPITGLGE